MFDKRVDNVWCTCKNPNMQTTTDNKTQRKPIVRIVGKMSRELVTSVLLKMLLKRIEEGHDDDQNNKVEAVPVLQAAKRN